MVEDHEVVSVRIRQRPKQHGLDDREYGDVRADAEGEREQRGDSEGRLANKLAERVADQVEEHVKALRLLRFGDDGVESASGRRRSRLSQSPIASRQQSRNSRTARTDVDVRCAALPNGDVTCWRRVRYATRRSSHAGSNASATIRRREQRAQARAQAGDQALDSLPLRGRGGDGLVEGPRLSPRSRAGGRDAVAPFANGLIADNDRLVPSLDEPVALEARHELIERGAGASHAVVGDDIADDAARLFTRENDAEGEELEMGKRWQLAEDRRHKVALYTISDTRATRWFASRYRLGRDVAGRGRAVG